MHVRTYASENNPSIYPEGSPGNYTYDLDLFEDLNYYYPHRGANFGFNTNNPDGFNVNTRQATFGLSDADETHPTNINFRGPTIFRFEDEQYVHEGIGDNNFGGTGDITDYEFDYIAPDPNEDEDDVDITTEEIKVIPPYGDDTWNWKTPQMDSPLIDGAYEENPITWQWSFPRSFSEELIRGTLVYTATGSIVSGALGDPDNNELYNQSASIWTASYQLDGPNAQDLKKYTLYGNGSLVTANFVAQKSASHTPEDVFPTFPDDGETVLYALASLVIESNKITTSFLCSTNLFAFSITISAT